MRNPKAGMEGTCTEVGQSTRGFLTKALMNGQYTHSDTNRHRNASSHHQQVKYELVLISGEGGKESSTWPRPRSSGGPRSSGMSAPSSPGCPSRWSTTRRSGTCSTGLTGPVGPGGHRGRRPLQRAGHPGGSPPGGASSPATGDAVRGRPQAAHQNVSHEPQEQQVPHHLPGRNR
jgi:hypothetical protein